MIVFLKTMLEICIGSLQKKEWKNLNDQKESFLKLWHGLQDASQTRFNLEDPKILITDQTTE